MTYTMGLMPKTPVTCDVCNHLYCGEENDCCPECTSIGEYHYEVVVRNFEDQEIFSEEFEGSSEGLDDAIKRYSELVKSGTPGGSVLSLERWHDLRDVSELGATVYSVRKE